MAESVVAPQSVDKGPRQKTSPQVVDLDRTGSAILELLERCYTDDHRARQTAMYEDSGWRSLVYIARTLKIPRSRVYGEGRQERIFSKTLETLVKSGQVEYRIFRGHRGRGGRIVKVRVKRDVDRNK